jgi:hypothetical protein
MKRLLAVVAQFVLFLFLDAVGGLVYQPFHLVTVLASGPATLRTFVWDGLVFMAIAYLLLLFIAAARKRLASAVPGATVALALAAVAGYALRLGFKTHDL